MTTYLIIHSLKTKFNVILQDRYSLKLFNLLEETLYTQGVISSCNYWDRSYNLLKTKTPFQLNLPEDLKDVKILTH